MNYNIFPASSDFGRKVADELLKKIDDSDKIIMTARSTSKLNAYKNKGIELRQADYNDVNSLNNAFKDNEVILIIPSTSMLEKRIQEINNVFSILKNKNNIQVILSSLFSTFNGLNSSIGIVPFYLYAESFLNVSNIPNTIVRNCYYAEVLLNEKELTMKQPAGDGKTVYLSKKDMAEATATVMLNNKLWGKTYTLTDDKSYDYYELANIISSVTDKNYVYEPSTKKEYKKTLKDVYNINSNMGDILIQLYDATSKDEDNIITNDFKLILNRNPENLKEVLMKIKNKNI